MYILLKIVAMILAGVSFAILASIYLRTFNDRVVLFFIRKCPGFVHSYLRKRRVRKIERQLVDGVSMLANGLRAGLSLQQTFQFASNDAPSPIKQEFEFVINQVRMGKNFEDALVELKNRIPLDDINILVESVLVLRQTGGNLVETFSSIAETIRERQKVSGRIRVVTAQGVSQAVIILVLPFALALGLYLISPWYILPMISEPLGWLLIGVALIMQTIGAIWLRKIVTIRI